MIEYKKKILANGLTVVVNRDPVSKLAAVNILYKAGARNENPERTGFAHLFEHLMFRGTRRIPNFDLPVHLHTHETAHEIEEEKKKSGLRPFQRLQQLGLVNDRLIAVHMHQTRD